MCVCFFFLIIFFWFYHCHHRRRRSLGNVNKWFDVLLNCLLLMFCCCELFAFLFHLPTLSSLFFLSLLCKFLVMLRFRYNSIFDYRRWSDSHFHCSFINIDVSFVLNHWDVNKSTNVSNFLSSSLSHCIFVENGIQCLAEERDGRYSMILM